MASRPDINGDYVTHNDDEHNINDDEHNAVPDVDSLAGQLTTLNINDNDIKDKAAIIIQSCFRGYALRKKNRQLIDSMTYSLLNRAIDNYNKTITEEKKINTLLKNKKIRISNFPSHISENIAKFVYNNKYKFMPNWDTDKGDLILKIKTKTIRIEVKGSIDLFKAPPSFGPKEEWDIIYFVNGINTLEKKYKVYEIKLSNKSDKWKNIQVNRNHTFYDQCCQGRRPRILFSKIQEQLNIHCKLIFDGHISELQ